VEDIEGTEGHRWRMSSGAMVGGSRGKKGGAVRGAPGSLAQRGGGVVGGGAEAGGKVRGWRWHGWAQ
jgi:hypothetical protein